MNQTPSIPTPAAARVPAGLLNFEKLPDDAYVKLPVVRAILSCGQATVWRWAKAGILPQPVKLGPRSTGWRVGDLRAYLASLNK